jgi:hypothetical protein
MEHAMRVLNGLSPLAAERPDFSAKEEKTATELEVMIEKKINRAARLRCHSRDVGRAVVRVYPDNDFGWRAQVITAPKSVEPFQIAAERTASDLRALYDLKNKHRLGKVA